MLPVFNDNMNVQRLSDIPHEGTENAKAGNAYVNYTKVQSYFNPVFSGNHTDLTILKIKDDFYRYGFSFHPLFNHNAFRIFSAFAEN
jgi:hypothetical protein